MITIKDDSNFFINNDLDNILRTKKLNENNIKSMIEESQKKLNHMNNIMEKLHIDNYEINYNPVYSVRVNSNKNINWNAYKDENRQSGSIKIESLNSIYTKFKTESVKDAHNRRNNFSDGFSSYNLSKTRERLSNELKILENKNNNFNKLNSDINNDELESFKPIHNRRYSNLKDSQAFTTSDLDLVIEENENLIHSNNLKNKVNSLN